MFDLLLKVFLGSMLLFYYSACLKIFVFVAVYRFPNQKKFYIDGDLHLFNIFDTNV